MSPRHNSRLCSLMRGSNSMQKLNDLNYGVRKFIYHIIYFIQIHLFVTANFWLKINSSIDTNVGYFYALAIPRSRELFIKTYFSLQLFLQIFLGVLVFHNHGFVNIRSIRLKLQQLATFKIFG